MPTPIEALELQVQSGSTASAVNGIDALSATLDRLKNVAKGGMGLTTVANQLKSLSSALTVMDGSAVAKIDQLTTSLDKLKGLENLKISSSIANQLVNIGAAADLLNGADFSGLTELSTAMAPLNNLGKATGLQSAITQLKKVPELATTLNGVDWSTFESQMQRLVSNLTPLASQLNAVSAAFSRLPSNIRRAVSATNAAAAANTRAGNSYVNFAAKAGITYATLRKASNILSSWITKSNKYIEDLNLFTASMGEYAEQAHEYAERVSEVMGIDPAEWMRNQGIFNTITKGFGVVADRAYIMSKNLTQLGYDLSSFFNISYEDAFQKLQSGIAGELEPLRRLGYDLSVARLQQEAYALGIDKSVNAMNQAEKSELRYYAIMTQVTTAQGDMARTLNAPANQLRILQAQITQAARALGNIFIPVLNKVLPYAIALAKAVRLVAAEIASLFGFELPEIDYSGLTSGASAVGGLADDANDAASGLGSAAENAKKLKRSLIGIDELTILPSPDTGSGGGGGGAGSVGGGGGLGFDLPEYDFLGDAISTRVDEIMGELTPAINWLKDNLRGILEISAAIGVPYLLKTIGDSMSKLQGLKKLLAVTATIALEFAVNEWSIKKYFESDGVLSGLKYLLLDVFSTGAASYLLYRTLGPTGLILGVGVGIVANAVGISMGIANGAEFTDPKTFIATALTVALGGIGGAIGLSKIGFFPGEGAVIGATFALSLSLTAINFGAIASGQLDSGSLASILNTVASSLAAGLGGYVLAGGLFGAAAGPVGLAIGLGVGLVINIVAASIADRQNIRSIVFDAFMESSNGQMTLTDIEVEFESLSQAVSASFQSMADSGSNLETVRTDISDTITSVNTLVGEVAIGAVDIAENIEAIKGSFDQLKQDSAAIFEEERQIIIQGLAGSIGEVAEAVGIDLPAVSSLVNSLSTTSSETARGFIDELSNLSQAYADGTISAEDYYSRYYGIMSDFQTLMGDTSALEQYAQSVDTWKSSMNFTDIVDGASVDIPALREIFTGFETSYSESVAAINEGSDTFATSIDDLKRAAETAGVELSETELRDLATLLLGSEADRASAIATMQGYYGEVLDAVQTNLFTGLEGQVAALEQEYESKSPVYKLFHSEAEYVQSGLATYNSDIVEPILAEIQSSMERIGLEGEPWATGAMQQVLDGLVTYSYDEYGATISTNLNDIGTLIQGALGDVSTTTVPVAEATGESIAEGLLNGNEDYINENKGVFESVISHLPQWTKDLFGIHSPSTVFAEIGGYMADGLLSGMNDDMNAKWPGVWGSIASTVSGGVESLRTQVSISSSGIGNPIISGFQSVIDNLGSFGWGSVGTGIATGIINGMYNIGSALWDWGSSLLQSVKNMFSIHSPSRVFADEVGYFMGTGVGVGFENATPYILSSIAGVSDDMQEAFAAANMAMTAETAFQVNPDMRVQYDSSAYAEFEADDLAGVMQAISEDQISVIYAAAQQVIQAINEKDMNAYMDGRRVSDGVADMEYRRARRLGHSPRTV